MAASALVGESVENPAKYYSNNLITSLSLLEAMRATGVSRLGKELDPPMPQFRLTREDAEAVLAYLKSLGR